MTYASTYSSNECESYTCTNPMCTACYYDTSAIQNNHCTACIENAFLIEGALGTCVCSVGFYYSLKSKTCEKCNSLCSTCLTGPGPDQCLLCKLGRPKWNGVCMESCSAIPEPFNSTYVYSGLRENSCEPCPDFHYTTNSVTCQP